MNTNGKRAGIAVATLAILLSGCSKSNSDSKANSQQTSGTSSAPAAAGDVVSLKLLQFTPSKLTVKKGTTVTWREDEPITHTVTSGKVIGIDPTTSLRTGQTPDGMFDKKLSKPGDTFSYTFNTPGEYSYFCSIHFGMNATVTVTP